MLKINKILASTRAAIDLASIMVGIIVIGIIGGVIAATVFAVIPWAQDNAAKANLDNLASAQSAYSGFAESAKYATTATLANPGSIVPGGKALFKSDGKVSSITGANDACYVAVAKSESGKFFFITNKNKKPVEFNGQTTGLPTCADVEDAVEEIETGTPVAQGTLDATYMYASPLNGSGTSLYDYTFQISNRDVFNGPIAASRLSGFPTDLPYSQFEYSPEAGSWYFNDNVTAVTITLEDGTILNDFEALGQMYYTSPSASDDESTRPSSVSSPWAFVNFNGLQLNHASSITSTEAVEMFAGATIDITTANGNNLTYVIAADAVLENCGC